MIGHYLSNKNKNTTVPQTKLFSEVNRASVKATAGRQTDGPPGGLATCRLWAVAVAVVGMNGNGGHGTAAAAAAARGRAGVGVPTNTSVSAWLVAAGLTAVMAPRQPKRGLFLAPPVPRLASWADAIDWIRSRAPRSRAPVPGGAWKVGSGTSRWNWNNGRSSGWSLVELCAFGTLESARSRHDTVGQWLNARWCQGLEDFFFFFELAMTAT